MEAGARYGSECVREQTRVCPSHGGTVCESLQRMLEDRLVVKKRLQMDELTEGNRKLEHKSVSCECLSIGYRLSSNPRVVQETVESAIQDRGNEAMTSFIRMGHIQIETSILRECLPGFDNGRAILLPDGAYDLVVFGIETEWSAAVHQPSDGQRQGRH